MSRGRWWRAGAGALLLVATVSSCVPAPPSTYPKVGYDNGLSSHDPLEQELRADTVSGLRLAWRRTLHLSSYSSLTVGEQLVYAIDGGGDLVALRRRTGAVAWEVSPDEGSFHNAPTLSGGTAFIGSMFEGRLYALDAATGRRRWSVQVDDLHAQSIPSVAHGLVYVFGDGHLQALDARTGARRFRLSAAEDVSPRVVGDELFLPHDYLTGETDVYDARTGVRLRSAGFYSSGAVSRKRRLFVVVRHGSQQGYVGSTTLMGHHRFWSVMRSDTATGPAVARGRVFFGTLVQHEARGGIAAVSAATGGALWEGSVEGGASSPPVVAGDVVYIGSWSDRIYAFAAGGCGRPRCAPLWSAATNLSRSGFALRGAVAVADGMLFVPGGGGEVLAYRLP